jgi:hypothetical protein
VLLHDRTSRRIARAFMHQPHIDVVIVPYHLGDAVVPTGRPEPTRVGYAGR